MKATMKRRVAALAASVAIAATLIAHPADVAQAQPAPLDFYSQVQSQYSSLGSSNDQATRDAAWNMRNSLRQQADGLAIFGAQAPAQAKKQIDQTVESLFPGLIAERTPKPAPAPAPAPVPAPAPAPAPSKPAFDYGPCPKDAKVCVDTSGRRSWLQNNGEVYYGSVYVGPGRVGDETPKGTFYVNRKVKDEVSYLFDNAPMPYAVYFTNHGHAFHQGDPSILSHGCVRMYQKDAQKYFTDLQIGDKVFIY
ncbi:hypothetical protein HMPREF3101_07375 [Corynebacterium sp. HMSC29G08]|nr:hypothetical protein HMPREF3101_07375 [Corynebacterium sp. HMSC29G08]